MRPKRRRSTLPVVCYALFLSAGLLFLKFLPGTDAKPASVSAPNPGQSKLHKHDHARLVEARANGTPEVTLIIASMPGANDAVIRAIAAVGGRIKYRDDDVSYLRAKVPTEKVESIARLHEVEALNVDGEPHFYSGLNERAGTVPSQEVSPGQSASQSKIIPPPGSSTPAENPYSPARDMRIPQFIAGHPTFDGRGVTIAIVEGVFDYLSPDLQTALTLDGKPVPKLVDVMSTTDPAEDENPKLVKMTDQVTAKDGRFSYKDFDYRVTTDQVYRIGLFDERKFSDPLLNGDLNRDGNPDGSSGLFAVLWDEATGTVWVDTNQNRSFADEKALLEYRKRHDIGIFGSDDPNTPVRESVPFTILTFPQEKYVEICIGVNPHATSVAGVVAGKSFFGGRMHGMAPEAQLVVVEFDASFNHRAIEAMILAVKHPKVDMVTVQYGNIMRLNDGNFTTCIVWDRLIEKYRKPIIDSAGNEGPAANTVAELSTANRVFSVGGYVHRETLWVNFGMDVKGDDHIFNYSSRGPREDGGFKPDFLAPASVVASAPGIYPGYPALYSMLKLKGVYTLPPGYDIFGGTSCAAPAAAGGIALLISAAKQSGISYDPERLRWAVASGARYLPSYGPHEQGSGLLQVDAAWEYLKTAPEPVVINSRAAVNNVLSKYLKSPDHGPGIYEREGWAAGQSETRTITFTRTTGPSQPVTYDLRWVGNDGTYSSAGQIILPLNTPAPLTVTVRPNTVGIHSANLNLMDSHNQVVYQVMNTVVAAEQFSPNNQFSITRAGSIEYSEKTSIFFNVPPDTAAFTCRLKILKGKLRMRFSDPSGTIFQLSHPFYPGRGANPYQIGGTVDQSFANPEPGVWEVHINNGSLEGDTKSEPQIQASFTLTAVVFGSQSSPQLKVINRVESGADQSREISFVNRMGSFRGGIMNLPLGSAFFTQPVLNAGSPQIFEVEVPNGATELTTSIGQASDSRADLDLYLFDCTSKECFRRDQSVGADAQETVTVLNPHPGKWKIVIDPFTLPAGQTTCRYIDFFTHPAFGEVRSTDTQKPRESNSQWTTKTDFKVMAVPASPRRLIAAIELASEDVNFEEYRFNPATRLPEPSILRRIAIGTTIIELKTPDTQ